MDTTRRGLHHPRGHWLRAEAEALRERKDCTILCSL